MDRPNIREIVLDVENGGSSSDDSNDYRPGSAVMKTNRRLGKLRSGFLGYNGYVSSDQLSSSDDDAPSSQTFRTSIGVKWEETASAIEKDTRNEKRKKRSSVKPPKPPNPKQFDAADMKIIREIAEVTKLKHARMERLKELKKKKAERAASSSAYNVVGLVVSILFFSMIVFHGVFGSRS